MSSSQLENIDVQKVEFTLSRFLQVLSSLEKEKLKIKEREELIHKSHEIYAKNKQYVLCNVCPNFNVLVVSRVLYTLSIKECEEAQGAKKTGKITICELFFMLLRDISDKYSLIDDYDLPVLSMIASVLRYEHILNTNHENCLLDIMMRLSLNSSFSKLLGCMDMWNCVFSRISELSNNQTVLSKYLKIGEWMIQTLDETYLAIDWESQIVLALDCLFGNDLLRNIGESRAATTTLIDFLCIIIRKYGLKMRDILNVKLLPVFNEYSCSKKLTIDDADSAGIKSLWSFTNLFLSLAFPDIKPSVLNNTSLLPACKEIFFSCLRLLTRFCSHRSRFTLSSVQIETIAKALIIAEFDAPVYSSLEASFYESQTNIPKKRFKVSSPLETLLNLDFESEETSRNSNKVGPDLQHNCLLIIHEVIVHYHNCMSDPSFKKLALGVWNMTKQLSDFARPTHCSVLRELVSREGFGDYLKVKSESVENRNPLDDPRVRIKNLWGYALSCSNIDGALDQALLLMSSILQKYARIFVEVSVVTANIHSTLGKSNSQNTLELLKSFLKNVDFDELSCFSGASDPSAGISKWKLRCQCIEWVVKKSNLVVSEELVLLCSLHPGDVQPLKSYFPPNNKKPVIKKEILSNLAKLNQTNLVTVVPIEKPNPILCDVLEYCINLLQDSWYNCEESNRSFLWNTLLLFMTEVKVRENELFPMFGGLLESINEYVVEVANNGLIEELQKLSPRHGAVYLSTEALRAVALYAVNNPNLFASFHLSVTNVPATYLIPILESITVFDFLDRSSHFYSSLMHRLQKLAEEVDYLPDILLIVSEFGHLLTREVNVVLLNRALEVHLEDKTSNVETDKLEYHRLLLVEMGILFKWPKIVEVLDADDFHKKSLYETIILNIEMCELPSAFLRALLDISNRSVILLRHLVQHILKEGSLWMDHVHVLTYILKDSNLTQVMMEHIHEFEEVMNFHAFSIAIGGFELPKENFFHSRFLSFRSNPVVKKRNNMDISCFPQALLLNHECWADVVPLFWNQVGTQAHKLLVGLRTLASTHAKLGLEHRFVCLLEAMTSNFAALNLKKAIKKPFQIVIRTLLVTIIRSLTERSCPLQQFKKCLQRIISIDRNVFEEEDSITMLLCSDFIGESCVAYSLFRGAKENMREVCMNEADVFINSGKEYKNSSFLMSNCFWECVSTKLNDCRDSEIPLIEKLNAQLNQILLIWEFCPRIRKAMTPILYIFGNEKSQLTSVRPTQVNPQQLLVSFLKFYSSLILNDIDRADWQFNAFALSVLSANGLDSTHFLYPIKDNIEGFTYSQRESCMAVQFCEQLFESSLGSYKSSPCFSLVKFCEKYGSYMSGFSYLLSPFLCTPENKLTYGQAVVKSVLSMQNTDFSNQINFRTARMFCECVDSCGLSTLESLSVDALDFVTIGEYFCQSGFHDHAYAIANIAFDKFLGKDRALLALEGALDFPKLQKLLLEIYIATEQVAALDSLPVWAQNDPRAQQMRLKESCRWPRVASDNISSMNDVIFAQWFSGIESTVKNEEAHYLQFLLRNDFDKCSFPKFLTTHWKRVYAVVFLRLLGYDSIKAVIEPIAEQLSESASVDLKVCRQLRDLLVFCTPFENVMTNEWTIEQQCLAVIHGFNCVSTSTDENRAVFARSVSETVLVLVKKLTRIGAHSAALDSLNNWLKLFTSDVRQNQILVEKCKIQVAMGDFYLAQSKLKEIASYTLATTVAVEVMCVLSSIYADSLKNLDVAIRTMKDLVESIPQGSKPATYATAYQQLYNLLVRKLSDLEGFMESPTAKLKNEAIREWKRQLNPNSTTLNEKQKRIVTQELKCEEEELSRMNSDLRKTVTLTVNSGLMLLKYVSPHDNSSPCTNTKEIIQILFPLLDIIFRYENIAEVSDALRMYAVDFAPSVWLPAFHHIVSHCFKEDPLSLVIQDMIIKLVVAYPYHVLHPLLAYKYDAEKNSPNSDKVKRMLLLAMKKATDSAALKTVLQNVSNAHTIYRNFNWLKFDDTDYFTPVTASGGKTQYALTSKVSLIQSLEKLSNLPLPTVGQPVGRSEDYSTDNFVKWSEIDRVIDKADGLSAPKILKVKGSNNVWYKMVWKKGEDVRQDSLVEHLFEVINVLINSNQPLRTYKVVPLDSQSGIIEFCNGTKSLKDVLVGSNLRGGLHSKIYPEENPFTARMKLVEASKSTAWPPKIEDYRNILRNVTPVFRHHFYQNFPTVKEWMKMINNYTQSVAEWSIVCFVIGLGDRHASNVLFEESSSNLVHIDLGMILEFGKRILHIPERVPFRLTRDILDPILIQGTHGNLKYRATYTMDKIRKHKEVILGLASVFLRETMGHFRDSSDGSRPSFVSATAIKRLKDKLDGTDRTVSAVSSHIQVERLMAEATNIENLSKLFAGWLSFI